MSETSKLNRRELFGLAGAAALTMSGVGRMARAVAADGPSAAPQAFRFVHLTDIHVQPELRGAEGLRACIQAVHDLKPRPDFILTGGDLVFDILSQSAARAKNLFDLYNSIVKDSDIPWRQCIGNHDVFGWSSKGKIAPDHVSYGKKMVSDRLGLERTTYSFDHKGWHFACVDDIQPNEGDGYHGGFSEEDLHWLTNDLKAAANRPKVICTHIPVISVTVFRAADATGKPNIPVNVASVCRNPGPILTLCREQKVNLVLTGHQHERETIRYENTTFIEDAAVCGAWWKGAHKGNPEGFGIIDAKADGTFEHRYATYGWQAEKA